MIEASMRPARLGDITTHISSGSTPRGGSETYLDSGPVMLIRSQNVRMNELTLADVAYITDETDRSMKRSQVQPGDVLLNITGASIGRVACFEFDNTRANVNQHVCIIRPESDACFSRYLTHLIASSEFQANIFRMQHGGTRQALTFAQIAEFKIPLPPLSEQKRIAEILDRAEALRAKRRAALALLDELTQSIFLDMFGDPVSNPKGWENSKTLAEVASVGSGITKGRRTKVPVRTVPYMAVVNVQDKSLNLSVVKTIDATDKEIDRYRLKRNDLLLTEGGDADKLGRGTLWNNELPECIHQNHIFRVRLETSEVTPLFLNWLVGGPRGKSYFLRQAKQTTGIATINMTQLKAFPMLIPPLKLQDDFAKSIVRIEDMRASHVRSLEELDQLFASLQHRAFRGELSPRKTRARDEQL